MTVSNAKLLLQQMQADPSLRTKIKSATEAAFAKATADAGHPTTVAHLNDALHEIAIDKNTQWARVAEPVSLPSFPSR